MIDDSLLRNRHRLEENSMKPLEAMLSGIARALLAMAAVSALSMTGLVVLASVMRYIVGSPFRFTEELVALLYAAMMFLTVPLCTLRNQHISVTLVLDKVGAGGRRLFRLLACLVTLAFVAWFIVESYKFAAFARDIGARSEQVDILLWPWMALMPATMALVAVIVAVQTVQAWIAVRRRGGPIEPSEIQGDPL
jgi:TRAP-type C4-dicarboxylate transport system permease small subunit